jgi:hypothetical protein
MRWRTRADATRIRHSEVLVETLLEPDIEGRLAPTRDFTEHNLTAPNTQQSRRERSGSREADGRCSK